MRERIAIYSVVFLATERKNMRIDELCRIQMGYSARGALEAARDGVLVIQLRDAPHVGRVRFSELSRYSIEGDLERYLVGAGDVLFRSRGDRPAAFVPGDDWEEPVVAAYPFMILRPDPALVDPAYLAWTINQAPAQRFFEREKQGATIMAINRKSLALLSVSVPDLPTQKAIGELAELQKHETGLLHQLAGLRSQLNVALLRDIANQTSGKTGKGAEK